MAKIFGLSAIIVMVIFLTRPAVFIRPSQCIWRLSLQYKSLGQEQFVN